MEVVVRPRVGRPTDVQGSAASTPQSKDELVFDNVINVEQHYDHDANEWPTIRLQMADGSSEVFDYATVDVSDTEPGIEATLMRDTTPSLEYQQVTTYDCYGVWRESYQDTFGNTQYSHRLFIDDGDEALVLGPHRYRGIDVRYENGERTQYGKLNRHSRSAERYLSDGETYRPPFQNSDGTLTLETNRGTFYNVSNVRRVRVGDAFMFDLDIGDNTIRVEEINGAEGPCYTACVKHEGAFGHGTTVTVVQRAIGLYLDETRDNDYALTAIGFPTNGGIYGTPQKHRIASLDEIADIHIKLPDGELQRPDIASFVDGKATT